MERIQINISFLKLNIIHLPSKRKYEYTDKSLFLLIAVAYTGVRGGRGANVEASSPPIFLYQRIFLATELKTGK
jgi:hypothetical protein